MSEEILPQEDYAKEIDPFDESEMPPKERSSNKETLEVISDSKEEDQENPEPEKKLKKEEPEIETKETLSSLKAELEKERARRIETQKALTKKAQQVKSYERNALSLKEKGALSDEEVQEFINFSSQDDDEALNDEDMPPLERYRRIANAELDNYIKYNNDSHLQEKVEAFRHYIEQYASQEEIEQAEDDLKEFSHDPVALIKKMLAIGQDHYDDYYKEAKVLGGNKALILKYKDEIFKLKKALEKSNNKVLQYGDYDKTSRYDLEDHSGPSKFSKEEVNDPFDDVKPKDLRSVKRR